MGCPKLYHVPVEALGSCWANIDSGEEAAIRDRRAVQPAVKADEEAVAKVAGQDGNQPLRLLKDDFGADEKRPAPGFGGDSVPDSHELPVQSLRTV